MKATFFAFFALLAASSPVLALGMAEGFETDHVVFYLPEEVMEARVWFVSSTRPAPDAQRESLRKKLEAIPPCNVHDGPVAFAISAKLAGGDGKTPKGEKDFKTPIPKEWQDAVTATGKDGAFNNI